MAIVLCDPLGSYDFLGLELQLSYMIFLPERVWLDKGLFEITVNRKRVLKFYFYQIQENTK